MKRLWRVRGVALHAFEFRLCVLVCWNEGRCEFIGIVRVVCINMNS